MIAPLVLCLVFMLSGAAALLFETLWFRGAGLSFGNSVWASSITLAAYMGGLALGNLIAARLGPRVRRPLWVYAGLELVIAAAGLALVVVLPWLPGVLAPWLGPTEAGAAGTSGRTLLQLGTAFALMMLPTTAMGATLPLLVKALCDARTGFGRALGLLYGGNTLGAMLGALAGELVLIERFGVLGTGLWAAGLDVAAAALCLGLAWRWRGARAPDGQAAVPLAETQRPLAAASAVPLSSGSTAPSSNAGALHPPVGGAGIAPLLLASALAGASLMGAEVLWFRFLRLFFLDTDSTFVVMLAVVLAGIGLGGMAAGSLCTRWARARGAPHAPRTPGAATRAAIVAAAACGIGLVLSYALFDPRWAGADWYIDAGSIAALSMGLMFPTAFASGALFTLLGQAVHEATGTDTQAVAWLTTANTVGAMLGALAAGFVLLPALGVEHAFWVLAGAYAVATAALIVAHRRQPPARLGAPAWAASAALLLAVLAFPSGRMQGHRDLASAKFRHAEQSHTVAVREGLTETVQYLRRDWLGQPLSHRLMTNGFSMSDSQPGSRRYMGLYAYWAAALQPRMQSALLISYGLGNTAHSLTQLPGLREIDVVDISRDILALAEVPYPGDANPLRDARVRVHVDDGRYHMQASTRRWDLITSEPPPPRAHGVVSLYTQDYFHLVRSRLNEGGLVTYWLPVHDMTAADAKAILRGFCNAFTDCALWAGYGLNWMMTGSRNALPPASADEFVAPWRQPPLRDALFEVGLDEPALLGTTFMADAAQLERMLGDAPALTDEHPKRYSQRVPVEADYRLYNEWMEVGQAARRFRSSAWIARFWPASLREATLAVYPLQPALNAPEQFAERGGRLSMLDAVLRAPGVHTPVLWLLGTDARAVAIAERIAAPADPSWQHVRGAAALARRDMAAAADHFEAALRAGQAGELGLALFSACRAGQGERARRLAEQFARQPVDHPLARCWP